MNVVPRSTKTAAPGVVRRQVCCSPWRDIVVATFTLAVYHIFMVEKLHSSGAWTKLPTPAANSPSENSDAYDGSAQSLLVAKTNVLRTGGARRIPHPSGPAPTLTRNHSIMKRAGSWAPIVLESHKLLFFDVPKVGSTGFKQLFLRMTGSKLWKERNADQLHWKAASYLQALSNFTLEKAQLMMTSPEWLRVIFVRDPKERLLSAFLDKVVRNRGVYAGRACCKKYHYVREFREKKWGASKREIQCMYELFTFDGFLRLAATECSDEPHWRAQSRRVDSDFWPFINFVGYMDSIAEDTKSMLEILGQDVWDTYGASGWGLNGNESIFAGLENAHHYAEGGASSHYLSYFTPRIEKEADAYLVEEYEHEVLKLPQYRKFQYSMN